MAVSMRPKRANTLSVAIAKQEKEGGASVTPSFAGTPTFASTPPAAAESRVDRDRSKTFHGFATGNLRRGAAGSEGGAGGAGAGAGARAASPPASLRGGDEGAPSGSQPGFRRAPGKAMTEYKEMLSKQNTNLGSPRGAARTLCFDGDAFSSPRKDTSTGQLRTARSPQPRPRGMPSKLQAKTAPDQLGQSPGGATDSTRSPGSPWPPRAQTALAASPPSPASRSRTFDLEAMALVEAEKAQDKAMANADTEKTIKTMRTAGAISARKRSSFGVGDRMEPQGWKQWTSLVDKQTLGAHYQYIVGELGSAVAIENQARREHDERLAHDLQSKRPEDAPHPLAGTPKPAAAVAFSDRALRLREGRGARDALSPDPAAPASPAASGRPGHHGEAKGQPCLCPSCNPMNSKAAGQPSHIAHKSKAPRCADDIQNFMQQASPRTRALSGQGFSASMRHLGTAVAPGAQPPQDMEDTLKKNFGRKARSPSPTSPGAGGILPHRSFTDDDVPIAGVYNQELGSEISEQRGLRRQAWQDSRHGVALLLSPRQGDPAPPTKLSSITKASGTFAQGYSEHSAEMARRSNQETFRFEGGGALRGRSQPPPRIERECAGKERGQAGNHSWTGGNPVTMHGKENAGVVFGYTQAKPDQSRWFRNSSPSMGLSVNHERIEKAFMSETNHRMKVDPAFAELCRVSQETKEWGKSAAETIKKRNGHGSPDLRRTLEWVQAD